MKRLGKLAAYACVAAVFLGGCSSGPTLPEVIDSPTVLVGEDGQITYWLVGEFDKDYYKISELSDMAMDEAAQFNALQGKVMVQGTEVPAVTVEQVKALQNGSGKVVVSYRFGDYESFTEFNEEEFFYGTVEEAVAEEFQIVSMTSVKDNALLAGDQIAQETDQYLIITDLKADIYFSGKVTHLSPGAVFNEDGSVDTEGAEGLVYILLK